MTPRAPSVYAETVWKYVGEHPGATAYHIALDLFGDVKLNWKLPTILASMERNGMLLSEDGDGNLYQFERVNPCQNHEPLNYQTQLSYLEF